MRSPRYLNVAAPTRSEDEEREDHLQAEAPHHGPPVDRAAVCRQHVRDPEDQHAPATGCAWGRRRSWPAAPRSRRPRRPPHDRLFLDEKRQMLDLGADVVVIGLHLLAACRHATSRPRAAGERRSPRVRSPARPARWPRSGLSRHVNQLQDASPALTRARAKPAPGCLRVVDAILGRGPPAPRPPRRADEHRVQTGDVPGPRRATYSRPAPAPGATVRPDLGSPPWRRPSAGTGRAGARAIARAPAARHPQSSRPGPPSGPCGPPG